METIVLYSSNNWVLGMWNSSNFTSLATKAAHVMRALWCGAQWNSPQLRHEQIWKNTWLNGRTDFSLCGVNPILMGQIPDAHFAWGVSSTRRSIHSCRKLNAQERFRVGTYPAIMGSWGGLPRKNMIQFIQSLKIFDAPGFVHSEGPIW